jgi:hypothetical protein
VRFKETCNSNKISPCPSPSTWRASLKASMRTCVLRS